MEQKTHRALNTPCMVTCRAGRLCQGFVLGVFHAPAFRVDVVFGVRAQNTG
jgi:hypothetical protein